MRADTSDGIDRRLFAIRQELERLLPRKKLDFYWSPLVEVWRDKAQAEGDISPLDALLHKKQVVLYGPPGTGKTHRAKLIAKRLIRSTALKRWKARPVFQGRRTH
jgi:5-methylcytosine-specific restriction enzyme B